MYLTVSLKRTLKEQFITLWVSNISLYSRLEKNCFRNFITYENVKHWTSQYAWRELLKESWSSLWVSHTRPYSIFEENSYRKVYHPFECQTLHLAIGMRRTIKENCVTLKEKFITLTSVQTVDLTVVLKRTLKEKLITLVRIKHWTSLKVWGEIFKIFIDSINSYECQEIS